MAITARHSAYDGHISFMVHSDQPLVRIADDPDERNWPFWIFWDASKLECGEREFLGIEVLDVADITDEWLAEIERLHLPRIDVPDAGLSNVTVADALRWARQTYPSRYAPASR